MKRSLSGKRFRTVFQNELDSISLADILDEYRQGASREQPIKIHCINHKGELTF